MAEADAHAAKSGPDADCSAYVIGLIDESATDGAILTCDSGTVATLAARHWTIRGHPFPGRQVIAYVGDGGFSMLMAEFLTAVRQCLPITVVVNNNNSLGQILREQMALGYPEHGVRYAQPVADFAAWASACGGYGASHTKRPSPPRCSKTASPNCAHDHLMSRDAILKT